MIKKNKDNLNIFEKPADNDIREKEKFLEDHVSSWITENFADKIGRLGTALSHFIHHPENLQTTPKSACSVFIQEGRMYIEKLGDSNIVTAYFVLQSTPSVCIYVQRNLNDHKITNFGIGSFHGLGRPFYTIWEL
jgi:hypothetical protein